MYGGQIGFDEGGVLKALSRPVWKQLDIEYDYDRKGNKIHESHRQVDLSIGDVLAVLVMAGVVTLTPFAVEKIGEWQIETNLPTTYKIFTAPGTFGNLLQRLGLLK